MEATMKDTEHKALNQLPETLSLETEEMEQRLEMQLLDPGPANAAFCVWFACTDVCPPGG